MNEIMSIIKNRRSRRSFSETEIPKEIIEEIIESGRYAPSALNKQPWKFIVIRDRSVIKGLSSIISAIISKIYKLLPLLKIIKPELRDPKVIGAMKKTATISDDTVFYNAPLLILIAADKKAGHYAARDCALAAQNMMLYASSLGIYSCFVGRTDFINISKPAKQLISLSSSCEIHCGIVFGYPDSSENMTAPLRSKDNVVKWFGK